MGNERTVLLRKYLDGYELRGVVDEIDEVIKFLILKYGELESSGTLDDCLDYITGYIDGDYAPKTKYKIGQGIYTIKNGDLHRDFIKKMEICNGVLYTTERGVEFYDDDEDVCETFDEIKERAIKKIKTLDEKDYIW